MASTSAVAQIMAKVARKAQQAGLTVSSQSASSVVIANSSNALTVSYVAPTITAPMGGVDPANSPYLGIGVANPGSLLMKSAISTAGTIADVLDGAVAARLFKVLATFANDLVLQNSASFSLTIRGDVDNIGMGQ